jgi:hypothetical protein
MTHYVFVTADYLRAIGVPLVAGRWLATSDHFDALKVLLINKTLALQYWPSSGSCLRQRIYLFNDQNVIDTPMTIVGVVGDVKDVPTDEHAQATLYQPFLENPGFGDNVVLRASVKPAELIPAVREVARRMGNDLTIQDVRPMEAVVGAAVATQQLRTANCWSIRDHCIGARPDRHLGVMSYAGTRRARDIAIRIALGAQPVDTLWLLLGHGARLTAAGITAGIPGAAALGHALTGMLYRVSASDPVTYAAAALLTLTVAMAACAIPARRVLSIDPMHVLRHE